MSDEEDWLVVEATATRPEDWFYDPLISAWSDATREYVTGRRGQERFDQPLNVRVTVEVEPAGDE